MVLLQIGPLKGLISKIDQSSIVASQLANIKGTSNKCILPVKTVDNKRLQWNEWMVNCLWRKPAVHEIPRLSTFKMGGYRQRNNQISTRVAFSGSIISSCIKKETLQSRLQCCFKGFMSQSLAEQFCFISFEFVCFCETTFITVIYGDHECCICIGE